jgi:hypothetical protein
MDGFIGVWMDVRLADDKTDEMMQRWMDLWITGPVER